MTHATIVGTSGSGKSRTGWSWRPMRRIRCPQIEGGWRGTPQMFSNLLWWWERDQYCARLVTTGGSFEVAAGEVRSPPWWPISYRRDIVGD